MDRKYIIPPAYDDRTDCFQPSLDNNSCCEKAIREFIQRVCAEAEAKMQITGRLEGAHYAALMSELAKLNEGK